MGKSYSTKATTTRIANVHLDFPSEYAKSLLMILPAKNSLKQAPHPTKQGRPAFRLVGSMLATP